MEVRREAGSRLGSIFSEVGEVTRLSWTNGLLHFISATYLIIYQASFYLEMYKGANSYSNKQKRLFPVEEEVLDIEFLHK